MMRNTHKRVPLVLQRLHHRPQPHHFAGFPDAKQRHVNPPVRGQDECERVVRTSVCVGEGVWEGEEGEAGEQVEEGCVVLGVELA